MYDVQQLTYGQYDAVSNVLSFALVSMIFASFFMLASLSRVQQRYRSSLVISATVTGIAAYHYWRIFESFKDSYAEGTPFSEAYRYVDWILTVPLLLVETVAVLALAKSVSRSLLSRLIPASALMIILGYPGEITNEILPKMVWGALSTIPFVYILYILFVELGRSLGRQPEGVAREVQGLRMVLLGTWGFYPIAYLFPVMGFDGNLAFVFRQYGYSIADILAKAVFGLIIYKIARMKSFADDPEFAKAEGH